MLTRRKGATNIYSIAMSAITSISIATWKIPPYHLPCLLAKIVAPYSSKQNILTLVCGLFKFKPNFSWSYFVSNFARSNPGKIKPIFSGQTLHLFGISCWASMSSLFEEQLPLESYKTTVHLVLITLILHLISTYKLPCQVTVCVNKSIKKAVKNLSDWVR